MKCILFLVATVTIAVMAQDGNGTVPDLSRPDIYGLINILYLKADSNFDGTITEAEFADVFHGFDINNNTKVTCQEFTTVWKSLTSQPDELAGAYCHLADLTHDGVIDDADIRPLYRRFDLNHDGSVSGREFAHKWEDIIRETPFAVLFEKCDADSNDFLTAAEFDHFFSSFDQNGDGQVNNQEFDQGWHTADFALLSDADDLFKTIDYNDDGTLNQADMQQLFARYNTDTNQDLSILEVIQMKSLLKIQVPHPAGPAGK